MYKLINKYIFLKIMNYEKKILLIFLYIIYSIPNSKSELTCPPDHFRIADYYWNYQDYEDKNEPLYGFHINYKLGSGQYDDYWSGIVYKPNNFCYESIRINENPLNCDVRDCNPSYFNNPQLISINPQSINVIDSDDTYIPSSPYVKIDKKYQNLKSLFQNVCETKNNRILIPMYEPIILGNKYVYYFNVVNPTDSKVRFKFQTHTITTTYRKISLLFSDYYEKNYINELYNLTPYNY